MKHAKLKKRIVKLKAIADRNPAGFKSRLAALVFIGYFAIVLYFLCFGGVLALFLFLHTIPVRLMVVFAIILFSILKMVFQKPPPPEGVEATRDRFPELLDIVDSAKQSTDGPDIHKVILNLEYNASVLQVPRISMFFGGTRNYLAIGAPLMATLSEDEFRSVLHHEFGHLSQEHSRFQQRVVKAAMIWEVMNELNFFMLLLFYPFVKFYSPLISCYIAVYQRHDEYEADAIAAKISGPDTVAAALYKIHVYGAYFMDKVLPNEVRDVASGEHPPAGLMDRFAETLAIPLDSDRLRKYREQAAKTATAPEDTHPSMMERLAALGIDNLAKLAPSATASAWLSVFNDSKRGALSKELGEFWEKSNKEALEMITVSIKDAQTTLAKLSEKKQEEWSEEDYLEFAMAKSALCDDEETLEIHKMVAEKFPENPVAMMSYGGSLLNAGDDSGLAWLEKSMVAPAVAPVAAQIAVEHLYATGKDEEAESWIADVENRMKEIEKAYKARGEFSEKDDYRPHGLGDDAVERIIEAVGKYRKTFKVAYLAKKFDSNLPGMPIYLFAFKIKPFRMASDDMQANIAEAFDNLPQEIYPLNLAGKNKLAKKLREVPEASIIANSRGKG